MTQNLSVAVIGLGYFSQFHLSAWKGVEGVTVSGVTDQVPEQIAKAEREFGVTGYRDLGSLLANANPVIVDIVAPPSAHNDLIRRCASPGRVLVCQKPFCQILREAEEVTKFAEKAGATLLIHENFRFQPWYRTLKQFLDKRGMGTVYQSRFSLRPGDGRGADAYLARQPAFQKMPRLLIHETGVHFIDLFRWLFGDVKGIYADLRQLNPVLAGEDAGTVIMDHAGGVQCVFDGNRLSDHATDNPRRTMGELVVEGEKGTLRLDGNGQLYFRDFGQSGEIDVPMITAVDENSFGGGCVKALCQHVADATRKNADFENLAVDYLPVLRATEAAYRSAQEGRKIFL
jgi:D-apiose dehydrogenase